MSNLGYEEWVVVAYWKLDKRTLWEEGTAYAKNLKKEGTWHALTWGTERMSLWMEQ